MDEGIVRRPVGPPPFGLRVAAVLAVPLLLYALVATGQKALDNYRLNQEAQALRVEIQTLRSENIELQGDIQDARTDAAIEALARQQLGLIRPGDNAVVLLADSAGSGPTAGSATAGSARPPPACAGLAPVVGVLLRLIDVSASDAVTRAIHHAAARLPDIFATDQRLLVAFSGGQDSSCLLHALLEHGLRERLQAAHVDHGLRPESSQQAERVADLATSMGATVRVLRVDVAAYRASMGSASVQQAARAARYQVLAAAAAEVGAAAVLVGHTADDQAETVLLNLVRGAGLAGLAGMRLSDELDLTRLGPRLPDLPAASERLRVARPLLRVARNTTLAYCAERRLAYVEDVSNQSRVYTRNRVRLDLLPLLEQFNPAIRAVLARTADLAGEDLAALDSVVAELHTRLAHDQDGGLVYDVRSWQALPRAFQRRLLRRAIQALRGNLVDVPAAPIEDALDVLTTARPGQSYHLPHGVELRVQQGTILLTSNPGGSVPPSV